MKKNKFKLNKSQSLESTAEVINNYNIQDIKFISMLKELIGENISIEELTKEILANKTIKIAHIKKKIENLELEYKNDHIGFSASAMELILQLKQDVKNITDNLEYEILILQDKIDASSTIDIRRKMWSLKEKRRNNRLFDGKEIELSDEENQKRKKIESFVKTSMISASSDTYHYYDYIDDELYQDNNGLFDGEESEDEKKAVEGEFTI